MQIHFGLANFQAEWTASLGCVGTFDGVHLGHRRVIKTAVDLARLEGLPCCVLTFDRHPASVLRPERCPPSIMGLDRKLVRFDDLGVSTVVILAFDEVMRETTADQFLETILVSALKCERLVIGHDFALGKDRIGDQTWLEERISTTVVPPFEQLGQRVSSSEVRRIVSEGDMVVAQRLLGSAYEISGVVVNGDHLGRTLGFPTANVARTHSQVMPPDGIYAGALEYRGGKFGAAISIGTRPSIGGVDRRIEAHCLDHPGGEFYGESCVLEFYRRVREQRIYPSLAELAKQINEDVAQVRTIVSSHGRLESLTL